MSRRDGKGKGGNGKGHGLQGNAYSKVRGGGKES